MTRRNAAAFTALCLLGGSSWIAAATLPAVLTGSLNLLIDHVLLTVIFITVKRKRLPPATPRILFYFVLLLALPGALASLVAGHLSSTTVVLVYTLVPAATIFFAAQASQADLLLNLGPALAGIAGAALILPFALPVSSTGKLWLAGIVVSALAAAFAALRLHTLLASVPGISVASLAAAAYAFIALPLNVYQRPTFVLLAWPQALLSEAVQLALEAATLLLTVRLLRDLAPVAFSTRYFLIPFVTIAEGYFIMHPRVPWTLFGGVTLLAGGSFLLFRDQQPA